jgi:hypothetical protein
LVAIRSVKTPLLSSIRMTSFPARAFTTIFLTPASRNVRSAEPSSPKSTSSTPGLPCCRRSVILSAAFVPAIATMPWLRAGSSGTASSALADVAAASAAEPAIATAATNVRTATRASRPLRVACVR